MAEPKGSNLQKSKKNKRLSISQQAQRAQGARDGHSDLEKLGKGLDSSHRDLRSVQQPRKTGKTTKQ
ncbi:hypothetical protein CDL15_Pgr000969 [Punica granatum]|uniref:Uncharacterized protein n=1 Tax=Punica granatum TaxID=22663 RepID=A0A218XIL9_PUNGR|nr:hypothetical protein CDL15_Pgr000969 [Punica granatum]